MKKIYILAVSVGLLTAQGMIGMEGPFKRWHVWKEEKTQEDALSMMIDQVIASVEMYMKKDGSEWRLKEEDLNQLIGETEKFVKEHGKTKTYYIFETIDKDLRNALKIMKEIEYIVKFIYKEKDPKVLKCASLIDLVTHHGLDFASTILKKGLAQKELIKTYVILHALFFRLGLKLGLFDQKICDQYIGLLKNEILGYR